MRYWTLESVVRQFGDSLLCAVMSCPAGLHSSWPTDREAGQIVLSGHLLQVSLNENTLRDFVLHATHNRIINRYLWEMSNQNLLLR